MTTLRAADTEIGGGPTPARMPDSFDAIFGSWKMKALVATIAIAIGWGAFGSDLRGLTNERLPARVLTLEQQVLAIERRNQQNDSDLRAILDRLNRIDTTLARLEGSPDALKRLQQSLDALTLNLTGRRTGESRR